MELHVSQEESVILFLQTCSITQITEDLLGTKDRIISVLYLLCLCWGSDFQLIFLTKSHFGETKTKQKQQQVKSEKYIAS